MTIDTAVSAHAQLTAEAPGRRWRLLAIALCVYAVFLVGEIVLTRTILERSWSAAWFNLAFGSVSLAVFLLFTGWSADPGRLTSRIQGMQEARVLGVKKKALLVSVGSDSALVPVELPRGRSHLRPGALVWAPDPFTYYDQQPLVSVDPDSRGRHVLWPLRPTSHGTFE